jgi:hypothetical protein
MHIEDFMDQMDAVNNNRSTPLYSGSPISVHDACVWLIRLAHIPKSGQNKNVGFIKRTSKFFPADCRLPKTIFTLFKMTNNDHHPQVYLKNIIFFICAVLTMETIKG